ncbi:MAG: hypothetical protein AB7P52_17695 [Alphaproteobacteria bacterium]
MTRPRVKCPICGDPGPFVLWVDPEPPTSCPEGAHVRNVTECRYQMAKAKQRAAWRKARPDAFDTDGNPKPGRLIDVLMSMPPDEPLVI